MIPKEMTKHTPGRGITRAPTDAERQLISIHELLDGAGVSREIPGIGTLAASERLIDLLRSAKDEEEIDDPQA